MGLMRCLFLTVVGLSALEACEYGRFYFVVAMLESAGSRNTLMD